MCLSWCRLRTDMLWTLCLFESLGFEMLGYADTCLLHGQAPGPSRAHPTLSDGPTYQVLGLAHLALRARPCPPDRSTERRKWTAAGLDRMLLSGDWWTQPSSWPWLALRLRGKGAGDLRTYVALANCPLSRNLPHK